MTEFPDFNLQFLPEDIDAIIKNHGCAVVREAISPDVINNLLQLSQQAYFVRDWQTKMGQLPDGLRHPGMYPAGHIYLNDISPDYKNTNFTLKNIINAKLLELMSLLTNKKPAFVISNCLPRRQKCSEGPNPPVPFHQDGSFLPGNYYNFWIPLVEVNRDAPGLEVIISSSSEILMPQPPLNNKSIYDRIHLPEEFIAKKFGKYNFWHPVLYPGDLFILTHRTIHRTYWIDSMKKDRISLEVRFAKLDEPELQNVLVNVAKILC